MATPHQQHLDAEARLWKSLGVQPKEYRVTLATGGEVRVQELGEGSPLVFIHGGSISGTSWCQLAKRLEGIRCILIDRPGCGLSDPIVGGPLNDLPELEAYADRLLEQLLDAIELEEATVAGTSYGGFFAFRGAAQIPDRVAKLVEYSWLIGAPPEGAPLAARMSGLPGMRELMVRMPMSRGMVKGALKQFGLGSAINSGKFNELMLDWAHALLRHTDTLANDTRSSPKLFTPIKGQNDDVLLSDELLAKLTMPVLFLWGENDPNGGAAIGRDFSTRLPNAELAIVPGAEHAPWIDDLETCATHSERFLAAS